MSSKHTLFDCWNLDPAPKKVRMAQSEQVATALQPDEVATAQQPVEVATSQHKAQLPPPSEEQQLIVEAVRGEQCVQITAYAGTGKTTCILIIVCSDNKSNLILTYNRALADETTATIHAMNLKNVVCRTYHSQVGIATGMPGACQDDINILQITREWDSGKPVVAKITQDRILLDEVQDMRPSFYSAVMHMVTPGRQMVVVGDSNQMLYDYVEEDPASPEYLEHPGVHFMSKTAERQWVSRTLSTSYRLTPRVTNFVNLIWGTNIVAGNSQSDIPVEYWCINLFNDIQRLRDVFDSEKPENVAVLMPCNLKNKDGKPTPLNYIINRMLLLKDSCGRRIYNFHTKDTAGEGTSDYQNKIRVWTYNASKGCTIRCTIVIGFNEYKGRQPLLRRLGVAISRSNHRLIVVHERDRYGKAFPYCKPLNSEILSDLVEKGCVVAPDGIPQDSTDIPPNLETEMVSVTSITHQSARTIERLLKFGIDGKRTVATHNINVPMKRRFHTGVRATEENVSSIYGVAIPFALEYARGQSIALVESMVRNRILVQGSKLYYDDDVVNLLREALIEMNSNEVKLVRAAVCAKLRDGSKQLRGTTVVDVLRNLRSQHRFMSNKCVCERQMFDNIFAEHHLKRVEQTYLHQPVKDPADFMYLANAYLATEGTHELFVQIGFDYSWVDRDAFSQAVAVLCETVPQGKHECGVSAMVEPPVHGSRRIVNGLTGCLDVQVDDLVAYELKFVRKLTCEHELQTLLYAAILAANAGAPARCVLFNARNGETIEKKIDAVQAGLLLREAATIKAGAGQ